MKKAFAFILSVLLILSVAFVSQGFATKAAALGNTYYINTQADYDQYRNATFSAGDTIIFKRGASFVGQFAPKGSGNAVDGPIVVKASDDAGPLPQIHCPPGAKWTTLNGRQAPYFPYGDGTYSTLAAVLLDGQNWWEISGLDVSGGDKNAVLVTNSLYQDLTYHDVLTQHIYLTDINAHDTYVPYDTGVVDIGGYQNSGKVEGAANTGPIEIDGPMTDIVIDSCQAHDSGGEIGIDINNRPGIYNLGPLTGDAVVKNCTIYNVCGDAILVAATPNTLVENNVAYNNGVTDPNLFNDTYESTGDVFGIYPQTPCGMWAWKCDHVVFRGNEISGEHAVTGDGEACDFDEGTTNCVYEYNYIHDNPQGGLMYYDYNNYYGDETTRNIVRYNIFANNSFDIAVDTGVRHALIYNNTCYSNSYSRWGTSYASILSSGGEDGLSKADADIVIKNNLVYSTGAQLLDVSYPCVTMSNNLYYYTGSAAGAQWSYGGKVYYGWDNYQAAGIESNSIFEDPLFTGSLPDALQGADPLGRSGASVFEPGPGSPALNAAVDMGQGDSKDFFYQSSGRAFYLDIGAVVGQNRVQFGTTVVTGISVTGAGNATAIAANGGTLQMSAAVQPTNATNKNVTWSVVNGTGSATISSAGLLTATGDGTVTVKAAAKDGSGVYGTLVITISGQASSGGTTDQGQGTPCSIYTTQIAYEEYNAGMAYDLGTKFYADVDGTITDVKLYTGANEGGMHTVRIWDVATGQALVTETWTFAAGSVGWRTFNLPTPLSITKDKDYVVSVTLSSDYYWSGFSPQFDSPINNGNLHTYAGSGVYTSAVGTIPLESSGNTGYFRDVIFVPGQTGDGQTTDPGTTDPGTTDPGTIDNQSGTNLIQNPNFEGSDPDASAWSFQQNNSPISAGAMTYDAGQQDAFGGGSRFGYIRNLHFGGNSAIVYQIVPNLIAGKTYTMTAWVESDGVKPLYLYAYSCQAGILLDESFVGSPTEWQLITFQFIAPANGDYQVGLADIIGGSQDGWCRIDSVSLVQQ